MQEKLEKHSVTKNSSASNIKSFSWSLEQYFLTVGLNQRFQGMGRPVLWKCYFRPTVRKYCSSDREKLLKFEADGFDLAKLLRLPDQFIRTIFEKEYFLNMEVSHIGTIIIPIWKNNWDLQICRKS